MTKDWGWGMPVTGHTAFLSRLVSPGVIIFMGGRGRRKGVSLWSNNKKQWPLKGESTIPT